MPLANDAFHIAVIGGDGIGPEVTAPALEMLRKVETLTPGLKFRFTEAPAGAITYKETGTALPESTTRLCEEADAIFLGACGMPDIRYPDGTEIAPQVELRFIFDLYAGVRPCRLLPGVPSPIVGADKHGIDLVVIRELTEGLFASLGKGVVTHEDAQGNHGDHAPHLGAAVRFLVSPRAAAQGARRQGHDALRRQGQHLPRLRLLPPDLLRARARISPARKPITSISTPARRRW